MNSHKNSVLDDLSALSRMASSGAVFQQAVHAFRQGRVAEAETNAKKALELNPGHADAWLLLGVIALQDHSRLAEACDLFDRVLQINPAHVAAHFNRGNTLRGLLRHKEALQAYRRAISLQPNYAEAHNNCGVVLMELGLLDEALASFDTVIHLAPALAKAHHMRGTLLLLQGNYREGWREYEWRWKDGGFQSPRRFGDIPRWDGSELTGKTILLHAEQGIGDEIMFATCVPEIVTRAEKVILECDPRLAPLLARSFPGIQVQGGRQKEPADWLASIAPPDWQLPTGSLPLFFRQGLDSFPDSPLLLQADESLCGKWRKRLEQTGKRLRVGISWRGGYFPADRLNRSLALEAWRTLLDRQEIAVINLQYGEVFDEIAEFEQETGIRVHHWDDFNPFTDLEDLAALIAGLDLVISIDNATVHLAAATGTPTWVLLPAVPDWRWLVGRTDSPWYPCVQLFRQPVAGDWRPVLEQVQLHFEAWLASALQNTQDKA